MTADLPRFGMLLLIGALVTLAARRLRLPYAIGLVLVGLALGALPTALDLSLSKELIFSLFLPPLVFEAALQIHWPELRRDLPVVGLLATVGVLLAAAVAAVGMAWLGGWSPASALVFGLLIAATDPVSVIATFREAGVSGRLLLLVEAESLLNDGTAAAAVAIALAWAAGTASGAWSIAGTILLTIGGGIACGVVCGGLLVLLARRVREPRAEIVLTTLTAYGSFLLAEQLHLSGILAALSAGLVAGHAVRRELSTTPARAMVETYWEYLALGANSIVFLLVGGHAAHMLTRHWQPALLAIALMTLGRAIAVYPLCALFRRSTLAVERRHQHVVVWGGLRGALALALALGLPAELAGRETLITTTFAVVIFSILVQGLSITPLMRRLGLLPAGVGRR